MAKHDRYTLLKIEKIEKFEMNLRKRDRKSQSTKITIIIDLVNVLFW